MAIGNSKGRSEISFKAAKDNIQDSYQYFKKNYETFNYFRKFVFESSLSPEDISVLAELGKPQLEFNILESRISRLRGEFASQEPTLNISPRYDAANMDPQLLEILNGHIRAIIFDSNTDNLEYDVFTDLLSGGFSAIKIYTDYIHEMSFDQQFIIQRCFDPTLVGFDKMARTSHKGDGMFAFELFPWTKERFQSTYGTALTEQMKFYKDFQGFSWSYKTEKEDVILIADYYSKKIKKEKIVQLTTGEVMTVKYYEKIAEEWSKRPDIIQQMPAVKGKARETELVTIQRERMVETGRLEEPIDTDFKELPLVFVDGNSINLRQDGLGSAYQLTRPYVYHAKGIQKLKNFAGCTLANELENMLQHKLMAPKEGIPDEYKDAFINQQKASILIYNSFKDDDPTIPLSPPQVIPRAPCPPEVITTFSLSDEITQAILGDYDSAIGNSDNQMGRRAVEASAMHSNSASKPYIIGYTKAWTQIGKILLDGIPKYYTTPRTIPTRDIRGRRSWVMINQEGSPKMEYDSNALELTIEPGVNFEVQKQRALETLTAVMKVSPPFSEFMTTGPGLEALLDNVDIKGIDGIKEQVGEFMQKMEQQKAAAMQEQKMQNPLIVKQLEIKQKSEAKQIDAQLETAKIAVSKQEADTSRLEVLGKLGIEADRTELEGDKIDAENARTEVGGLMSIASHQHTKAMDILALHHENEHKNADRENKRKSDKK